MLKNKMKVARIGIQGGWLIFYADVPPGQIAAGRDKEAKAVKVGDTIIYEPVQKNFGWFIGIANT